MYGIGFIHIQLPFSEPVSSLFLPMYVVDASVDDLSKRESCLRRDTENLHCLAVAGSAPTTVVVYTSRFASLENDRLGT